MKKKKRLMFESSQENIKKIDELKKSLGISTRTELIRLAISLISIIVKKNKEGFELTMEKEGETVHILIPGLKII